MVVNNTMAIMNSTLQTPNGREAFFIGLYKKVFPVVARYIARTGGGLEQAQDVFQDAIVIYYEKLTTTPTNDIVNEKAFLVGVAKKLWLQQCRQDSKNEPLADTDIALDDVEAPSTSRLMNYLQTAGKKCMELLKACYYDGLKPDAVAIQFSYSGTRSATVAKYKCLEKVRDTVKQNSLSYADFVE